MDLGGRAKRVRIYLNEGSVVALVEFLRSENAAGASVFRVVEGFGASGQVHTDRLVDVVQRLPDVIEWVDTPARVARLLPRLREMVHPGLITVEDVEVVLAAPPRLRPLSNRLTAGEVMSRQIATVTPQTALDEVVELLLGKIYRAVPVVDAGLPVGIITNTDLVLRGGLTARMELLPSLDTPALHEALARLIRERKTASDVMTPAPVTVRARATLSEVADLMAHRRLKRLPVVDEHGVVVGVISRLDLLRTVAEGFAPPSSGDEPREVGLAGDLPVERVMRRDVPTVHPDTPLPEVMQAVASTRLNRAVVVDAQRRVVGLITDAALLDRVTPSLRPGALRSLMHRLPFVHASAAEAEAEHHASARCAADLMTADVPTARTDQPLRDALVPMLRGREKLVVVVDNDGRLVGVVDRADMLRGLADRPA